jgi:hypothetical protein
LGFYVQDLKTPGQPFVAVTEAQYRAQLAVYTRDVDGLEAALVADLNWFHAADRRLWQSVPGTFNPALTTNNPSANLRATHRRGDSIY